MNRRQILTRIVQGFTVTGLAFLAYPFFRAFLPVMVEDTSFDIDVSDLSAGESKTISWLGRHLFVIRRSRTITASLPLNNEDLKDPFSRNSKQPEFAGNVNRSLRPDIFIVFTNCTHLGCEVSSRTGQLEIGFECPCHESQFDPAGRVRKDAVAGYNLEVPDYQFVSRNLIRLIRA